VAVTLDRGDPGRPGPGTRRVARELALRLLFQFDLSGGGPEAVARTFENSFSPDRDEENGLEIGADDFARAWPLAREFFFGVCGRLDQLDRDISRAAANWTLARMSPVDRGLIRLAYYEILHRNEIPPKVSLNEALEIAKSFGDDDSAPFINGVLDKLMREAEERRAAEENNGQVVTR
jgi:N utilization substance protein B